MTAIITLLPKSKKTVLTNSKLGEKGIQKVYLTHNLTSKDSCYISDEYSSTVRRSDSGREVKKSICIDGKNGVHLVRRKRRRSFILIPEAAISEKETKYIKDNLLHKKSRVRWIELYINRFYDGKYLRITFPYQKWSKYKRNLKKRKDIIFANKDSIYALDTYLRPVERFNIPNSTIELRQGTAFIYDGDKRLNYPEVLIWALSQVNFRDYILKNFITAPFKLVNKEGL